MDVTAIVLTKNEEKNIGKCLESVSWCSHIIVVDDESTDKTVEIAKGCGAKVYSHKTKNDFASHRNWVLKKSPTLWVLFIDADEIVTHQLADEIRNAISDGKFSAYFLKRSDYFISKELKFGETGQWNQVRLAQKTWGVWTGKIHEEWKGISPAGQLISPIHHHPHPTINNFLSSIDEYTTIRAKELFHQKETPSVIKLIVYPIGKFINNYFFKQGYRDGPHGLVHALVMAFHSYLVRSKLWILYNSNDATN